MDTIYGLTPVDKTAKTVISQTGCSGAELSDEQLRENLVKKAKILREEILMHPKKSAKRKALGQEFCRINLKINAIRPKKKAKGVDQYFIDTAREFLSKPQFNIIMSRAVEKMNNKKKGNQHETNT